MTTTAPTQHYADPAEAADDRADLHRERAIEALASPAEDRRGYVAVAQALLALDQRISELCVHVSRIGA